MSSTTAATGGLLASETPLHELVAKYREVQGAKPALIHGTECQPWADFVDDAYRIANALIALGVRPGDRVAVLARNSLHYASFFVGTLLCGGCAVPLQPLATSGALAAMLTDANVRAIALDEPYHDLISEFIAGDHNLYDGAIIGFDFEGKFKSAEVVRIDALMASASATAPGIVIEPSAQFNIIYSSGTTGIPKGILHNHQMRQGLVRELVRLGVDNSSINLMSTPMYSNTTIALWWPTFCAGGTQVIMEKFEVETTLRNIEKHGVTHAMLVPVQYERIMRSGLVSQFDLSSLKTKFSTSAPLRVGLKEEILDRLPGEFIEIYGMTEGGGSTLLFGTEARKAGKLGSVGKPIPGHEMLVVDDSGAELPRGEIGEIVGRSDKMSEGYNNRASDTEELCWYDSEGRRFFRTGDIGYFDEDNWLFLSDRRKDIIISGGFNIYATDLERVLLEHPEVIEAAAIALPSEEWGETPLAVVVPTTAIDTNEEDLRAWANDRLGRTQRIAKLIFVDALPRNPIGKVLKKDLREKYRHLGDLAPDSTLAAPGTES